MSITVLSDEERQNTVLMAKLAEQSERYDDMVVNMQKIARTGSLQMDERNLLSVAYKVSLFYPCYYWSETLNDICGRFHLMLFAAFVGTECCWSPPCLVACAEPSGRFGEGQDGERSPAAILEKSGERAAELVWRRAHPSA